MKPYYSNYHHKGLINEWWGQVLLSLNRPCSIIHLQVWGYSPECSTHCTRALRPRDQITVLVESICWKQCRGLAHIFQSDIWVVYNQKISKAYMWSTISFYSYSKDSLTNLENHTQTGKWTHYRKKDKGVFLIFGLLMASFSAFWYLLRHLTLRDTVSVSVHFFLYFVSSCTVQMLFLVKKSLIREDLIGFYVCFFFPLQLYQFMRKVILKHNVKKRCSTVFLISILWSCTLFWISK